MKEKIRWIILILAVVVFGLIVYSLNVGTIHIFDNYIYDAISKTINPALTVIAIMITNIGGPVGITIVTIILILALPNKNHKKYILINLASILLLNQGLKFIFSRERPDINRLVEVSNYSFPSGHAMTNTAFYGFLIYLIYKYVEDRKTKYVLIALISLLVIAIGLSRIYLGVHYASDVVGGAMISIAYLIVFTILVRQKLD